MNFPIIVTNFKPQRGGPYKCSCIVCCIDRLAFWSYFQYFLNEMELN